MEGLCEGTCVTEPMLSAARQKFFFSHEACSFLLDPREGGFHIG